jgi:hypothetical protein
MKLGWLLFGIGLVVGIAGLFAWQIAVDSPGWNMSGLVKVLGILFVVLGSITGIYGIIRIAGRKKPPPNSPPLE